MKCELCGLDNLPPAHWMSFMHMDKEINADRARLEELNKDA